MRTPTFAKAITGVTPTARARSKPRTLLAAVAPPVLFNVMPGAYGAQHAPPSSVAGALELPHDLMEAVDEGDVTALARWLARTETSAPWDAPGQALLVRAAAKGHADIVLLLLQHGADPDGTRHDGTSALGEAASEGHLDVVALLLGFGASVNRRGGMGATPLYSAVADRHVAVSEFLKRNGADTLIPDVNGIHPLMIAEFYGGPHLLESLR